MTKSDKRLITIEGSAVTLRPATIEDATFLYELREVANISGTVHDVGDFAKHKEWLEEFLPRDDDYFFIIELRSTKRAVGTIALAALDKNRGTARLKRWLILPGYHVGIEGILLGYQAAFEHLDLKAVDLHVLKRNRRVVRFHEIAGLEKIEQTWIEEFDGKNEEMVEFRLSARNWPVIRDNLRKTLGIDTRD